MTKRPQTLSRAAYMLGGLVLVTMSLIAGVLIARIATQLLAREQAQALTSLTTRLANLVEQTLRERKHEAQVLAGIPNLVAQAETAASAWTESASARVQLAVIASRSSFEVLTVTDRNGHSLLTSTPTDSAHASVAWWHATLDHDQAISAPIADALRGTVALEIATTLKNKRQEPVGMLVATYPLEKLGFAIQRDLAGMPSTSVEVVDQAGRIVYSSASWIDVTKTFRDTTLLKASDASDTVHLLDRGETRTATLTIPELGWRVIAHEPRQRWLELITLARRDILVTGLVFTGAAALVLFVLAHLLRARVIEPVEQLATVSAEVARGNLVVGPPHAKGAERSDEIGRLVSSTQSMVGELRGLVGAIRSAADEAADLAGSMSAATEQMTASTGDVASTTYELSERAARQATLARLAAADATSILAIAQTLATEAIAAAERSAELARIADEERHHLDASAVALIRLAEESGEGAREAEALGAASQEIERFVTLIRRVADQTQLLSLNASIEAAHAGDRGRGFTVVAEEVRRLADRAREAATKADETVNLVHRQVESARERLVRLAQGGLTARDTAGRASAGLTAIAGRAAADGAWGRRVSDSATRVQQLVGEIASRTTEAAASSDDTAAAAAQIAAATQQLSASTSTVATSAVDLAAAAGRLTGAVSRFRIDQSHDGKRPVD